jgi:ABC-type transport system involved in multi-copper enzyme maturation permease subunit
MSDQILALKAEILKNRHSKIIWITFIAFALAPLMGAMFIFIIKHPDKVSLSGMLKMKANMVAFLADWNSYLSLLSQAIGVGGVLIFGFVASWLFGREYSDGTAKDLLALPVSRTKILNAKFIYYALWCLGLSVSNLVIGFVLGALLNLDGWSWEILAPGLKIYFITAILTIFLNVPIAFFAISGRGYMAPLGFVAITLVLAQIIAAAGFGNYFPWSVPGLYSGSGGPLGLGLNSLSFTLLFLTSFIGYTLTILWWKYSDQVK